MTHRHLFFFLLILAAPAASGQNYLWTKVNQNGLYAYSTAGAGYWASSNSLTDGTVTYQIMNYGQSYSMFRGPGYDNFQLFSRDSTGKQLATSQLFPTTGGRLYSLAIDNNHRLHSLHTSIFIGTMGNYYHADYSLIRYNPDGSIVSSSPIGAETQGSTYIGASDTYFQSGRLAVDETGADYLNTDRKAYDAMSGAFRTHRMNLCKWSLGGAVVWDKPFGDTAKVSAPTTYNRYETVGCSRGKLFVRGTLLNDSFWYDGVRHKAATGQVLLRFDTSGVYQGYVKVPNWTMGNVSGFDSKGNLLLNITATTGATVQLDTTLSVTVPSIGARHTIVACINPKTGMCLWYSTLYSTFGNTLLNAIQIQPGGVYILTGTTSASMVANGTTYTFGNDMFRGELDSTGAFTLLQRNPIVPGGTAYPQTGYKTPGGDLLITDFIYNGNNYQYGCDSISAGSMVMARWTPASSLPAPQTSAWGHVVAPLSQTRATLRWNAGSGRGRLLLLSDSAAVTAHPANGVVYPADSTFGNGTSLGARTYVTGNKSDTFITVKGLQPGTRYFARIVEYNGCGSSIVYETSGDTFSFQTPAYAYYTKATGPLNDPATWGDQPNGSGTPPPALNIDSTTFYIHNNLSPYMNSSSITFSTTATVVLGDSSGVFDFELPDTSTIALCRMVVKSKSKLTVKGSLLRSGSLTVGRVDADPNTDIAFDNAVNVTCNVYAWNLQVKTTGGYIIPSNTNYYVAGQLSLDGFMKCNSISIGQDSLRPGSLLYSSGGIYAGYTWTRYYKSSLTTGDEGFFPLLIQLSGYSPARYSYRPFRINFTTAPVSGGMLTVRSYEYPSGGLGPGILDTTGGDTAYLARLGYTKWEVSSPTLTTGRFTIEATDTNPGGYDVSGMRIFCVYPERLAGTWPGNGGTTSLPLVRSSGVSLQLASFPYTFMVAASDSLRYAGQATRPTVQASDFVVTDVSSTIIKLKWKRGNGLNCMVLARQGSPIVNLPLDSNNYTGNANFGLSSSSNLGNNTYVVYAGTANNLTVTNLQVNKRYYFTVLEYNGLPNKWLYLASPLPVTDDSTRTSSTYYNKAGQPLSRLGTWGMKPDGSGDTLKSFSWSNVAYRLVNGSSCTLTDSLTIAPATTSTSSRFFVGNGAQSMQLTIASGARMVLGNGMEMYLSDNAKLVVNGGFSCRSVPLFSYAYTAEMELNSSEMTKMISPMVGTDVWIVPKLKVKGGYYYELPVVEVIDSLELDAMVKGTLTMNNMMSGTTVVNLVGGGSTAFGHRFYNGFTHDYPTILIDSTSTGYVAHTRPAQVRCTYPTAPTTCNEPFILECGKDISLLSQISGFPLTDTSISPPVTVNSVYTTRTTWKGRFGWNTTSTCSGGQRLDVYVSDTLVPATADTHAFSLWTHLYNPTGNPVYLHGQRMPYYVSGNKITVGRQNVLFPWASPFGAIFFGLAVDSVNLVPLPVSWLSFTANPVGNNVQLRWATASEINNSHFEIERSADGKRFEYAGRVDGHGTTSSMNTYRFTDTDPFGANTVLYYRLRQVDYNGQSEYSEMRLVERDTRMSEQTMQVNPNPFTTEVMLTLNSKEPASVLVRDVQGRVWYNENTSATQQVLSLQQLPAGIYLLTVTSGEHTEVRKLVKTY